VSNDEPKRRVQRVRLWAWLTLCIICGVWLLGAWIALPGLFEPKCLSLLHNFPSLVQPPLPAGCAEVSEASSDDMVKYLEHEREERGLIFEKWIACTLPTDSSKPIFPFEPDSRWLPSYVPGTYQFRRTVVIISYARPVPTASRVVAEVCLVPWTRYVHDIGGKCDGNSGMLQWR
jgi:hypothetical protein